MKLLRALNDKFEEIFLIALMSIAVLLVSAQVVTRLLGVPLPWSEESARYIFLWLVWVGAAYATKEKKHIVIDVIVSRLPKVGKMLCGTIVYVLWVGFLIFMIYVSFALVSSVYIGGGRATGSGVPMWIPYASVPVGMALMIFRLLQNLYLDFRQMKGGKETQ